VRLFFREKINRHLLLGNSEVQVIKFTDPDPFQEFTYLNALAAKRAIADYLDIALAKFPPEQLDWINALVSGTLNKRGTRPLRRTRSELELQVH
jgi:hypothetical protein